ncbi:MAG: hypothetical protein WKF37_12285 [Bryobacteraceae bacterium]
MPQLVAAQTPRARPKIAAITTIFFKYSHAQHIVDRFLEGYGWNGTHHQPAMDLVSLYVDQIGEGDLSKDRARRFPSMKMYPTIAEALTLGGSKLAVDGVVVVGEHGRYPRNEKGQTQYPRYEFFQEIFAVLRASGRVIPIFNDKHLSWNWEWARQIYETARELGVPFMAGSSLPVTWRTPSLELPAGATVREALCLGYGGVDSYDFHALETIQCMVGVAVQAEVVKYVRAYRGAAFGKLTRKECGPANWLRQPSRAVIPHPSAGGFNDICRPGRHAAPGQKSRCLSLRASGRPSVDHAPDVRSRQRFQLRSPA